MAIFPNPKTSIQDVRRSQCCSTCIAPWRWYIHYTLSFCWLDTIRCNSGWGIWLSQASPLTPKLKNKRHNFRVTGSVTARVSLQHLSNPNSNLRKYLPCVRYHRQYTTSGDSFLRFTMHYTSPRRHVADNTVS